MLLLTFELHAVLHFSVFQVSTIDVFSNLYLAKFKESLIKHIYSPRRMRRKSFCVLAIRYFSSRRFLLWQGKFVFTYVYVCTCVTSVLSRWCIFWQLPVKMVHLSAGGVDMFVCTCMCVPASLLCC